MPILQPTRSSTMSAAASLCRRLVFPPALSPAPSAAPGARTTVAGARCDGGERPATSAAPRAFHEPAELHPRWTDGASTVLVRSR